MSVNVKYQPELEKSSLTLKKENYPGLILMILFQNVFI